ncbi:hypothetical protein GCM10010112_87010 [Actinoplanes lobatus]|uniref:Uncharacterized protein n=1 Tax=Actinoplanes lobatus TaxID=113568 RepID=A0A7W7HC11_9ACTN|nr:XF1762 family protein [Actinoplanes lobatus]MBB4747762.1 hypothetical protein [Actinoplanes lobatus]GGN96081.1 hypothetical protein GCM10010112_87010 [Actinoplanes lobatus]GIE45165.1 hypothetical protein Alo02nite_80630 [Actinoplanes lobatus]
MAALRLVPVTFKVACEYVDQHHRHHTRPQGYRFAVGVLAGERLAGVAMAGRPVSRILDDGKTIEVIRVATDGTQHACSMLYGACWRAARALGYLAGVTYTQLGESGASLRAAGWRIDAELPARPGWDAPGRRRPTRDTDGIARVRWRIGVPVTVHP